MDFEARDNIQEGDSIVEYEGFAMGKLLAGGQGYHRLPAHGVVFSRKGLIGVEQPADGGRLDKLAVCRLHGLLRFQMAASGSLLPHTSTGGCPSMILWWDVQFATPRACSSSSA